MARLPANPWHTAPGAGCSPVCREGILGVLRARQTPQLILPQLLPPSHLQRFHVGSGSVQGFGNPQWILECQVCGFWHHNNENSGDYCALGLSSGWPRLGQLVFALWRRAGLVCEQDQSLSALVPDPNILPAKSQPWDELLESSCPLQGPEPCQGFSQVLGCCYRTQNKTTQTHNSLR